MDQSVIKVLLQKDIAQISLYYTILQVNHLCRLRKSCFKILFVNEQIVFFLKKYQWLFVGQMAAHCVIG